MSSEYEHIVGNLLSEKREKLEELSRNPELHKDQIAFLTTEIETLLALFENYTLGMNVFRRAQGGRINARD